MFSLWQLQGDRIHGTFWAARSGRLGATATTRSRSSPGPGGATSQGCNRFGCWPHWNHRLLDGLYLNQFKRRSLIKTNCCQTFLSHSWSGVLFFFEDKFETQYHFEIQTHHSPIPFIFLKSPETDTVAVNWNRATEKITKTSLATKCQSLWKKCSEAANDCCSQRDALPVNSQRYMQQAASPLNLLPQMLLVGSYRKFFVGCISTPLLLFSFHKLPGALASIPLHSQYLYRPRDTSKLALAGSVIAPQSLWLDTQTESAKVIPKNKLGDTTSYGPPIRLPHLAIPQVQNHQAGRPSQKTPGKLPFNSRMGKLSRCLTLVWRHPKKVTQAQYITLDHICLL